jgi:hypothetical protein
MNFILGLLLIIFIFRLVSWLALKWMNRKIRKATGTNESYNGEAPPKPEKKKKIAKDRGDYVDFEEMK